MSKAGKLRDRLAAIQKEREDFEKHKRELEHEMNIGKQNIGKIQKGLKNNTIINDPVLLENNLPSSSSSSMNTSSSNVKKLKSTNSLMNASFTGTGGANSPAFHGAGAAGGGGGGFGNGLHSPAERDGIPGAPLSTPTPVMSNIIPSGPRISDWCFTGTLDSFPPIVKARDIYENVRLLGRGAFGEVNLVKNVEDNKL
jgi:hypothetical protein